MSDKWRIAVIALLMTLALAGMVAKKQYTLDTGALVVLKTAPIDPRSLFRGDYVRLNYDISRLDTQRFPELQTLGNDAAVYVTLRRQGEYWKPVGAHGSWPTQLAVGDVVIRGRVHEPWRHPGRMSGRVQVKYGIETYFVPEGEGRKLERLRNREKIALQVAVDRFGNAGIKAVLVDGKPLYVETLF